jgi:hypothetical protein
MFIMVKEIPLGISNGVTLVDDEDFPWLSLFSWHIKWNGTDHRFPYAGRLVNKKYILMHRVILSCPPDKIVDHKNRNTLDNQRHNLRICGKAQNSRNVRTAGSLTNGIPFKGISKHKDKFRNKPWSARLFSHGRRLSLGYYRTPEEAAEAYNAAALQHFGEFACLNDLEGVSNE